MSLPMGELELAAPLGDVEIPAGDKAIEGRSLGRIAMRSLLRDKVAMTGGIVALLIVLVAIFAKQLTDLYGHSYVAQNNTVPNNLTDPSTTMPLGHYGGITGDHWLGVTPVSGQDVLAQIIYGARTSMIISSLALLLALVFGISLGVLAGYYRGIWDTMIARSMDTLLAFPVLLFSIALITVFSQVDSFLGMSGQVLRYAVLVFVIGFFAFPYIGRIVRGQVLSLREKEFVDAARSLGASNYRIMSREILPNLIGPILVYATLSIPNFMLAEAGLSFLGVGVQSPTVSWGSMLSDAGQYFQVDPTYLFCPGIAIFIAVLAFNLFGDGLRDALDPKSSR
ncbi:MAG: ABC transporter permease [Jatrophihabitantaceae bacterium]